MAWWCAYLFFSSRVSKDINTTYDMRVCAATNQTNKQKGKHTHTHTQEREREREQSGMNDHLFISHLCVCGGGGAYSSKMAKVSGIG